MEQLVGEFDAIVIGRTLLALVLCGLIGLERSTHERASGLRPHILVGLGACLMTQAGAYGFAELQTDSRDPMRVASYVVSGIGFLGAGAILRHGATVRGLTTAASLWGAAGIGIAVGAGMGVLAAVTVALVLFTLTPLQRLEAKLRFGPATYGLALHLSDDNRAVGKALAALGRLGVPVQRATMLPGIGSTAVLRVELSRALGPGQFPLLVEQLLALKFVERVDATSLRDEDDDDEPARRLATDDERRKPVMIHLGDVQLLRDLDEGDGDDATAESENGREPARDRATSEGPRPEDSARSGGSARGDSFAAGS